MKGKTRQILAITLVAAALCADRAIAAAPSLRPQVASAAGKLVTRLSVSLRRSAPSIRVYEARFDNTAGLSEQSIRTSDEATHHGMQLSPLMLHLPPPAAML